MTAYYLEFGGGLGDIFNSIYSNSGYRGLSDLQAGDLATIALICHNPFAPELFLWHPNRRLFDVRQLPYWQPHEDHHFSNVFQLPKNRPRLHSERRDVEFFPSDADRRTLAEITGAPYIVIAAGAGEPARAIPLAILEDIAQSLLAAGLTIVLAGRTYDRSGRFEPTLPPTRGLINAVDRLTVPGTALLVEKAAGLICSHSSLNILAWHMRKVQLLLYPQSVFDRHFAHGRDEWSFGLDWHITQHSLFQDYSRSATAHFLQKLGANRIISTLKGRTLLTGDRLESIYNAVKETEAVPGAMAVLGVYKGGSTRLISTAAPGKRVLAFDTFSGIPNADEAVDGHRNGDFADTSFEEVSDYLADCRNVSIIPGVFPNSTIRLTAAQFSFVYFDGDTAASTKAFLDYFYPQMSPGGIMVFDDYGWQQCQGVKSTVDEFFKSRREKPLVLAEHQCTVRIGVPTF